MKFRALVRTNKEKTIPEEEELLSQYWIHLLSSPSNPIGTIGTIYVSSIFFC